MWELDYLEQCGNNSEDFQMVRDVLKLMFLVRRETTITMSKRNYNITRDLIVDLKGFNFNFFTYRWMPWYSITPLTVTPQWKQ